LAAINDSENNKESRQRQCKKSMGKSAKQNIGAIRNIFNAIKK
jgi:hypothetical protein